MRQIWETDFQDATVELGQLTQIQTQTQIDDPEYCPSLKEESSEFSSSSDFEESVIATPSSILSPSIATKKSRISESIVGNKLKNNKHTVYQGKLLCYYHILLYL